MLLITLLLGLALAKQQFPTQPDPTPARPGSYLGTYAGWFAWDQGGARQPIKFTFDEVVSQNGDQVVLSGHGVYQDTDTHIKLRCELNTSTRAFKIFESDPRGVASTVFETDGFHQGICSEGYGQMPGRWVSQGRELGTLRLTRI